MPLNGFKMSNLTTLQQGLTCISSRRRVTYQVYKILVVSLKVIPVSFILYLRTKLKSWTKTPSMELQRLK